MNRIEKIVEAKGEISNLLSELSRLWSRGVNTKVGSR